MFKILRTTLTHYIKEEIYCFMEQNLVNLVSLAFKFWSFVGTVHFACPVMFHISCVTNHFKVFFLQKYGHTMVSLYECSLRHFYMRNVLYIVDENFAASPSIVINNCI